MYYIHICIYTHVCLCVYIHIHIYVNKSNTYTYIYIYIYMGKHRSDLWPELPAVVVKQSINSSDNSDIIYNEVVI